MYPIKPKQLFLILATVLLAIIIKYPQPEINIDDFRKLALATDSPSSGIYPNCDTVVVITGVTSGIGLELTKLLYEFGVGTIFGVGRSEAKLKSLSDNTLAVINSKSKFIPVIADLNDLDSVAKATKFIKQKTKKIDYLINNAGIHLTTYEIIDPNPVISAQGFEKAFAVNYLSHFLFTEELLPLFKRSNEESRIVQVSSSFHWLANSSELSSSSSGDPPNASRGDVISNLQRFRSYATSKLAQILHARSLNLRFRKNGDKVRAISACPNWTHTNIGKGSFDQFFLSFGFPVDGYGLQSVLNAMFHNHSDEDDFISNSDFFRIASFEVFENLWTSSIASTILLRDIIAWGMAFQLLFFQKFFVNQYIPSHTSPDSYNVQHQEELYEWSKDTVASWLT